MKKIFLTFLLFAIYPITAGGDTIFLKDGKKITTKKAWEENGLIKFYLEGSESIIITYSKNIIDRIESQSNKAEEPPPKIPNPLKPPAVSAKNFREPTEEKEIIRDEKPQNLPQVSMVKKPDSAPSALTLHAMGIKKSDGLLFYNPRRKNKYWTSNTSRHDTLEAAMASLAKQYGRSPEWVIANIGSTNSLYKIHKNLGKNLPTGKKSFDNSTILSDISKTLFYNPRRPKKFWASSKSRHNTLESAIAALAEKYGRSPEWIRTNMGNTNKLYEIHKNLTNSKLNSPSN